MADENEQKAPQIPAVKAGESVKFSESKSDRATVQVLTSLEPLPHPSPDIIPPLVQAQPIPAAGDNSSASAAPAAPTSSDGASSDE